MRLNLALAQIATSLGDVQCNLDKHLNYIELARKQKADLVVFPELSLTGYVLQDLVATVAHKPTEDDPIFRPLLEASQNPVSYTHLRAHETPEHLVCRLL